MNDSLIKILLILSLLLTGSIALDLQNLVGIWKVKSNDLPRPEPTIVERALGRSLSQHTTHKDTQLLITLNEDGTFRQCNEGFVEGSWMTGRWALVDTDRLTLALNRQYYGPPHDMFLQGTLQRNQNALVAVGNVLKGRIALPRTDPNFFEKGLVDTEILGPFQLIQTVALTTTNSDSRMEGALFEDDGVFQ